MSDQANERAFETHVEETLLGASGWQRGADAEWDVERALFPVQVCNFLQAAQPRLWSDMRTLHGDGLEALPRLRQLSVNYVDFHFFPRPK